MRNILFTRPNNMDDDFEGLDGGNDAVPYDGNAFGEDFIDEGDDTNNKLRLQAATHYFIGKICDNEGAQRNTLNAIYCQIIDPSRY